MTQPTDTNALRDPYEVANQLAGYVGPNTDPELAEWLLRESKEAALLADELDRLRAELDRIEGEHTIEIATGQQQLNDLANENMHLRAELSEARKENAWQPIEAAPSDGDMVVTDGHRIAVAFRDSGMSSYRFFCPRSQSDLHFTPTHWMNLPELPERSEHRSKSDDN